MSIEGKVRGIIRTMNWDRQEIPRQETSAMDATQTIYSQALRCLSEDPRIYYGLAASYMSQGQYLQAGRMARKALRMNPHDIDCLLIIIQVQLALSEYDDAIVLAESCLVRDPSCDKLRAMLGLARYGRAGLAVRKRLIPDAVEAASQAAQDLMESHGSLLGCAFPLAKMGSDFAAMGLLEQASSLCAISSAIDPYCVAICELLNEIDTGQAKVNSLVERLFSVEEDLRLAAAKELMAYESHHAARGFLVLGEDPCPMMRESALIYLAKYRIPHWLALVHLLHDKVDYVRSACASFLATCEDEFALDHLEVALGSEKDAMVKERMQWAAAEIMRRLRLGSELDLVMQAGGNF